MSPGVFSDFSFTFFLPTETVIRRNEFQGFPTLVNRGSPALPADNLGEVRVKGLFDIVKLWGSSKEHGDRRKTDFVKHRPTASRRH